MSGGRSHVDPEFNPVSTPCSGLSGGASDLEVYYTDVAILAQTSFPQMSGVNLIEFAELDSESAPSDDEVGVDLVGDVSSDDNDCSALAIVPAAAIARAPRPLMTRSQHCANMHVLKLGRIVTRHRLASHAAIAEIVERARNFVIRRSVVNSL
jgi:hypothetical protein